MKKKLIIKGANKLAKKELINFIVSSYNPEEVAYLDPNNLNRFSYSECGLNENTKLIVLDGVCKKSCKKNEKHGRHNRDFRDLLVYDEIGFEKRNIPFTIIPIPNVIITIDDDVYCREYAKAKTITLN